MGGLQSDTLDFVAGAEHRGKDLAGQMLQALDDPAAVITLSIMRCRGMRPEITALEKTSIEFHIRAL